MSEDGRLLVPVLGQDGEIQSLQTIGPDGSKRFHTGGRMGGGWCLLGTVREDAPLLLAEGFATGASLHQATGFPVYVAFTAGNLETIARMLRGRFGPSARIVVAGDDDRAKPDNRGRKDATAAARAVGGVAVFPSFGDGEAGSDFNDMAASRGADAVAARIHAALSQPEAPQAAEPAPGPLGYRLADWRACDRFQGSPPERQWLVRGVFPKGRSAIVASAGGIGKSFLLLELCVAVAGELAGTIQALTSPLFGGVVEGSGAVVYVTAEDDIIEVHTRLAAMGGIPRNLFIVPLPDAGGVRPLFANDRNAGTHPTAAWMDLCEQLIAIPDLALVVIDPLQPFAACDLNAPEAAQTVGTSLGELAAETGASAIASHHFAKGREIETPAQAREAIRGSGGLVDGVRMTYALWPAKDAKGREVCAALGEDYQPERVIFGAVVKVNGAVNRSIVTYVRTASGLLRDRSSELRQSSAPKTTDMLPELKRAIARAAGNGQPYTKTGESGLYKRRFELGVALQELPRAKLDALADDLLRQGEIVQVAVGRGPAKHLDVPNGPIATGTGELQPGFVAPPTAAAEWEDAANDE